MPGYRTVSPPRYRVKKQDDVRLSYFVRTVDRVTFPEAHDSSNFPREVYHFLQPEEIKFSNRPTIFKDHDDFRAFLSHPWGRGSSSFTTP